MSATDIAPQLTGYALDSSWYAERDRLSSLTALYDEATTAFCERLGVGDGWRCAEVGAGTGSVAQLLADRVGPSGRVLAVDLDTRFLEPLRSTFLQVEQMDVRSGSAQVWADTDRGVPQWELLLAQLRPALLAQHLLIAADFDAFAALCRDGDSVFFAPLMVSCAGRKPRTPPNTSGVS